MEKTVILPTAFDIQDLPSEVWRLRSLIDACIHLFPESSAKFEHEDELFAVLGVTQQLIHSLECKLSSCLECSPISADGLSEAEAFVVKSE